MVDLVIPEDFCQTGKPTGKTSHSDGENFHWIWGKGSKSGAAFSDDNVKAAYEERGEKPREPGVREPVPRPHPNPRGEPTTAESRGSRTEHPSDGDVVRERIHIT